MSTSDHKDNAVLSWMKNPASWLSVLSLIVTGITFYLVNLRRGNIEVKLPDQIGIAIYQMDQKDALKLIVPTLFHYTGSPNRRMVITKIWAAVVMGSDQGTASKTIPYDWRYLYRFVDKYTFEKQFPELARGAEDYIQYEGRNWLFGLSGGDVVLKVLGLEPISNTPIMITPGHIELYLDIVAEHKSLRSDKGRYELSKTIIEEAKADGLYKWLNRHDKNE